MFGQFNRSAVSILGTASSTTVSRISVITRLQDKVHCSPGVFELVFGDSRVGKTTLGSMRTIIEDCA